MKSQMKQLHLKIWRDTHNVTRDQSGVEDLFYSLKYGLVSVWWSFENNVFGCCWIEWSINIRSSSLIMLSKSCIFFWFSWLLVLSIIKGEGVKSLTIFEDIFYFFLRFIRFCCMYFKTLWFVHTHLIVISSSCIYSFIIMKCPFRFVSRQ